MRRTKVVDTPTGYIVRVDRDRKRQYGWEVRLRDKHCTPKVFTDLRYGSRLKSFDAAASYLEGVQR